MNQMLVCGGSVFNPSLSFCLLLACHFKQKTPQKHRAIMTLKQRESDPNLIVDHMLS